MVGSSLKGHTRDVNATEYIPECNYFVAIGNLFTDTAMKDYQAWIIH